MAARRDVVSSLIALPQPGCQSPVRLVAERDAHRLVRSGCSAPLHAQRQVHDQSNRSTVARASQNRLSRSHLRHVQPGNEGDHNDKPGHRSDQERLFDNIHCACPITKAPLYPRVSGRRMSFVRFETARSELCRTARIRTNCLPRSRNSLRFPRFCATSYCQRSPWIVVRRRRVNQAKRLAKGYRTAPARHGR